MKHYKIKDNKLILTDSSPWVLAMPFVAVALTFVSTGIQLINNWTLELGFLSGLNIILFLLSVIILSWALIKKTFKSEFSITDIIQIKQSSVSKSTFYLVLKNSKQRNLSEVRESKRATELLIMLRSENPSIAANFIEKEVETR